MTADVLKHMEFIQTVIQRMAGNSFLLKGWTVTLSAALFALAAKDSRPEFAVVALFPALSFWGLDAFYLRQERLFRKLYDDVRKTVDPATSSALSYSLSTKRYARQVDGWFRTLWSPSVVALHGVVVGVAALVIASIDC